MKEATGGQVSRPEGYTVFLTTQSDKPPAGVFKQKLATYRDIRDGKIVDKRKLPVLYEYPDDMVKKGEHLLPEHFYLANPNIGRSVTQEWLEEKAAEADNDADGPRAVFYAKHLNVEIGVGLRHDAWVGGLYWTKATAPVSLRDRPPNLSADTLRPACDAARHAPRADRPVYSIGAMPFRDAAMGIGQLY